MLHHSFVEALCHFLKTVVGDTTIDYATKQGNSLCCTAAKGVFGEVRAQPFRHLFDDRVVERLGQCHARQALCRFDGELLHQLLQCLLSSVDTEGNTQHHGELIARVVRDFSVFGEILVAVEVAQLLHQAH